MVHRTSYTPLIKEVSLTHNLDPNVVEAVVIKESGGLTHAYRFEPRFWATYLAKSPIWGKRNPHQVSASYGLMQILYVAAFELGFKGEPEELFVPSIGLEWGCHKLGSLIQWASTFPSATEDEQKMAAYAAYNGGKGGNTPGVALLRNGVYAEGVVSLYNRLSLML